MTWQRLLASPMFWLIAVVIILALTGGLVSLATTIASALIEAINRLFVPVVVIIVAVLLLRRKKSGGRH